MKIQKNNLGLITYNLGLEKGQALITLLFFMIIAITITSAAVIISIVNSLSTSYFDQANSAYYVAEAGAENAIIRLLRDPSYTGETLNVDTGSAVITVSGTSPYVITSVGKIYNSLRKIEVDATIVNGVLTVTSWKEAL